MPEVGRRRAVALRWRALRAFSLPVSTLPVVVATAAVRPIGRWRWDVLVASVLGAGLLHLAGNLLNDLFDFRYGVDRKVDGDEGRPGRLLVRKQLRPRDVATMAVACLLLAAPPAGYLLWRCGMELAGFAAVGAFALYAYTGPPFRLKYHALGEVLIFVAFGPALMAGAAWAQTGRLEPAALLLSVPVGFITTAVLVGNNIRDRREDGSAGIRTIASFAGGSVARGVYLALVCGAVAAIAALGATGWGPMVFLAAPLLLVLLRRPLRCVWRDERLADIDVATAQFVSAVLAFLLAALVLRPLLAGG